jgi:lipopolysaccharide biosynthesis glycosyltransferase
LVLDDLQRTGIYTRPMKIKINLNNNGRQMWDTISDAPMATEFAVSRFLIKHLTDSGYALFMDCDILVRGNIERLFEICEADSSKAVWCVKHKHEPRNAMKMDNQLQMKYPRKNWSSMMVMNVDHPANSALTPEMVNSLPGRDLHRLCWLKDEEIGELSPEWNYLVGHNNGEVKEPKIVHFTDGGPWMLGYERVDYADEWREARNRWAAN